MLSMPPPLTQAMGNIQIHELLGKPLVAVTYLPSSFASLNVNSESSSQGYHRKRQALGLTEFGKMLLSVVKKGSVVGYNVL